MAPCCFLLWALPGNKLVENLNRIAKQFVGVLVGTWRERAPAVCRRDRRPMVWAASEFRAGVALRRPVNRCCLAVIWLLSLGVCLLASEGLSAAAGTKIRAQQDDVPEIPEFKYDRRPIIDREPYDRITFENGQEADVHPMNLPPDQPLPRQGKAMFRLLDEPDSSITYAAPWNRISEVRGFPEIIMDVAKKLEARGELGEAYRYYNYLMNHPQFEGRRPEIDLFEILVRDAGTALRERSFWDALVCFEELKRQFPARRFNLGDEIRTASEGIRFCVTQLLEEKYQERSYRQIRELLATTLQRHPRETTALNEQWTQRIHADALQLLSSLQEALDQGDPVLAQDRLREMLDIAPDLPEAVELRRMILQRYPMVIVGVDQLPAIRDPRMIESWAARRAGHLVRSQLMEFVRQDEEGGVYRFSHGSLDPVGEDGREYRFRLRGDWSEAEATDLTSIRLARLLDSVATPGQDAFHPLWGRVLQSVEVEDPSTVRFRLHYPFLLPTALLQVPLIPTDREESDGPYVTTLVESHRVMYGPNPAFAKSGSLSQVDQNRMLLLERVQLDPTRASELLMSGGIDVLDRVFPGEVPRLRRQPDIEVRRYQIPSVHWLIPNPRNDWVKNQAFRRGLLYAIDRERLVGQILTNNQSLDGYQVVSGPFPVGIDESDPLMYANNFRIRPVPYSQDLGAVFVKMAASQIQSLQRRIAEAKIRAAVSRGEMTEEQAAIEQDALGPRSTDEINPDESVAPAPLPEPPEMVLAFPKGAQAETICAMIARYWQAIGIKTRLVELPDGQVLPENDDYDFVFVECTMQEPLVDARRIFGQTGLVKEINASVEHSLDRIDRVRNWQTAGAALRNLHEKVYNESTILPLWQVPQYYAFRSSVRNVGFDINSLYQNVDQWRIEVD